jgi:hypothetical protein
VKTLIRGRRLVFVVVAALALLTVGTSAVAFAANNGGKSDLAKVKGAVAKYHQPEKAMEAGWVLVPGLDHCFDNPGVGAMGVHYIDGSRLDTTVDVLRPEALVYQHKPNGDLHLGAVEYIVPAEAWDAEGHAMPPEVLGHHMHLNEALGVYVLHAWIFTKNPAGTFEDWNPNVSCPPAD